MNGPLGNTAYRHLFAAQALSLLGTGLTTIALGLLAYDLAGADAGMVLGTALAIKMIAYVGLGPIGAALAERFPRRPYLVSLDLVRATLVLVLPFVSEIWQIYLLIFLFQACSAAFTPTFQATIPDLLPDEKDYTRALSLSRLLYDLEQLLSPVLAGLLLTFVSFHWLFVGNTAGFLASAAFIVTAAIPRQTTDENRRGFWQRVTRGTWIYLKTPRLRGLLALSFAVASAGSMVIVNTVVFVRTELGGNETDVAIFFAAAGLGSMAIALTVPRLLERIATRPVMICGGAVLCAGLIIGLWAESYAGALAIWVFLGAGSSLVMTPSGLLLRQSSHAEDRPALFAAQFALSHGCWLVAYPVAGWMGSRFGMDAALIVLAGGAATGSAAALMLWPRNDPAELEHEHEEVVHAHATVADGHHRPDQISSEDRSERKHRHRKFRHRHVFVIDDHHTAWPRSG
ncbi:MFS transporter [Nisaea sediminum]|uniref:MFS transporter n=1 Tax=Nisaea sediminum TaxID=2775867 RepID=UPI001868A8B3|nr:MFS transporter [Nisaea sediminum]